MKFVICLRVGSFTELLTLNKIYGVIDLEQSVFLHMRNPVIVIKGDNGEVKLFFTKDDDGIWFEDATSYIRENKLNELGICQKK